MQQMDASIGAALVAVAVGAPALGAAAAAALRHGGTDATRPNRRIRTAASACNTLAAAAAAVTLGAVVAVGPWRNAIVVADRLTASLLAFTTLLGLVVGVFAGRNLATDPAYPRFVTGAAVTLSGTGLVIAGAGLGIVCAGWLLTTAGVFTLLGRDVLATRRGRRLWLTLLAGDAALVAATLAFGNAALGAGAGAAPASGIGPAATTIGAAALAVAAIVRAAQPVVPNWLPTTLAAPSPVSALLHAGVLNAGGILLVRTAGLTGTARVVQLGVLAAGGIGIVAGCAAMRTRADIKGALVSSTTAQMGFMLVEVAVALPAAALLHVIGHGGFKASLFLSAGGAVDRRRRAERAPAVTGGGWAARHRTLVTIGCGVVPATVLVGTGVALGAVTTVPAGIVCTVGAITLATAGAARLARRNTVPAAEYLGVVAVLGIAGAGIAALLTAAETFLAPALVATAPAPGATAALGLIGAGLAAVGLLSRPNLPDTLTTARDAVYLHLHSRNHGAIAPTVQTPISAHNTTPHATVAHHDVAADTTPARPLEPVA